MERKFVDGTKVIMRITHELNAAADLREMESPIYALMQSRVSPRKPLLVMESIPTVSRRKIRAWPSKPEVEL